MNYSPIPPNDYPPEWNDEEEPQELDNYGDDDEYGDNEYYD